MSLTDFLFGTPDQTGQLDPETKAARNFLLNQMLQLQSAGPVNVPTYVAQTPQFATAGQNQLLAALGMDKITTPSMPTENVGGVTAYTSMPLQTYMEEDFKTRAPAQYNYLKSFYMDPVTGAMGSRAYNPNVMGLNAGGMPTGGNGSGGNNYNLPWGISEDIQNKMVSLSTNPNHPDYYDNFRDVYDYNYDRAQQDPYGQTYGVGVDIYPSQIDSWLPPSGSDNSSGSSNNTSSGSSWSDTWSQVKEDFGSLRDAILGK